MRIAVQGCAHGELDAIYDTIRAAGAAHGGTPPPDLLLCCGDFQCTRDADDLATLAVPARYARVTSFAKYHSGAATAPVLTVFVGGNHEASAVLAALPLGGWVAPNIYYLGAAGGVTVGGLRLGGLSGIFKAGDYRRPRSEVLPYSPSHLRSVYHVREEDVKALLAAYRVDGVGDNGGGGGSGGGGGAAGGEERRRLDVFMSHDWPAGVTAWGDADRLVRCKPFFRDEVTRGALGSAPSGMLLAAVRPRYWFAGHLHVKFAALVPHPPTVGAGGGRNTGASGGGSGRIDEGDSGSGSTPAGGAGAPAVPSSPLTTRFLALDKVLPNRDFLQLLDIPTKEGVAPPSAAVASPAATARGAPRHPCPAPLTISRDPAWLAVLAAGRVAVPPSAVAAMVSRLAAAGVPLEPPPPVAGVPREERLGVAGPDGRVLLSVENARLAAAAGIKLQGVAMPPALCGNGGAPVPTGFPPPAIAVRGGCPSAAAPAAGAATAPALAPASASAPALTSTLAASVPLKTTPAVLSDAAGAATTAAATANAVTTALADVVAGTRPRGGGEAAIRPAAVPPLPPPSPPSPPPLGTLAETPNSPLSMVVAAAPSAGANDSAGGGGNGGGSGIDPAPAGVPAAVAAAALPVTATPLAAAPIDDGHGDGGESRGGGGEEERGGQGERTPDAKRQRTDPAPPPPR